MSKRPTTPPWTFRSVGSVNEVTARWGDQDCIIARLDSKSLEWHEDSYCAMLENDANARLIAAAPETAAERDWLREVNAELLAALKECSAVCAGETLSKQSLINALEKACAAIAKATGGENV